MKIIKRLLPVIFVAGLTVVIVLALCSQIMEREQADCWVNLEDAAQSINDKITTKFNDEIVKLHMLEALMLQENSFSLENVGSLHLDMFQPTTIFSRIDVFYPDGTVMSNGSSYYECKDYSFDDAADKGEHITTRLTDPKTGRESVYYVLPVARDGETCALLIGVIDAQSLSQVFYPTIYDGQASICIIDSENGNYIMDSWHDDLGNAYAQETRKRLKNYENIDLKDECRNHRTWLPYRPIWR